MPLLPISHGENHMLRTTISLLAASLLSGCVIVANVDTEWAWGGNWKEETHPITDVDSVEFDARGTLYIMQGSRKDLRMEGHEQALQQMEVYERAGVLFVTQANDDFRWWGVEKRGGEVVFYLEMENLTSIKQSGHGEINVGPFTVNSLDVETRGHAETNFSSINARQLEIRTSEHSNINIETLDSDSARLVIVDHADLYAHDITSLDIDIRVEDHGEAWLAGKSDSTSIRVKDHGDVDANRLQTAIAEVRASDHSKVALTAGETIYIARQDHAQVSWQGTAEVDEEQVISQQ